MKRYGGLGATYGSIFDDTSEIVSDILNDKIEKSTTVTELNINDIEPNREQPRKFFSEEKLSELADSIKTHGLLQPVVVRVKDGGYQIISGERRWRAAKLAGVRTLPVRVVDADDITVLQLALVENLQREDLNPLEEAEGYQLLASKFDMTQEEISKQVGKARATIANLLRLTVLPDEVKQMVRQGLLSLGQCKILLGLDDADQIIALAKKAVAEELTVKRLEQIVKLIKTPRPEKPPEKADIFLDEAKISLRGLIGKPTEISKSGEKYVLKITFDEKTEISDIISRLSNEQI